MFILIRLRIFKLNGLVHRASGLQKSLVQMYHSLVWNISSQCSLCENQKYAVVCRTSTAGIPLVRLSFLLVSDHRTSEISNPAYTSLIHLPPVLSTAYMRPWTGLTLVQVMACCLMGTKPLSIVKLVSKYIIFIHENAFENFMCETVAICSRGRWVKAIKP